MAVSDRAKVNLYVWSVLAIYFDTLIRPISLAVISIVFEETQNTSIALCTARRGYAIPLSIPHRHFLQASGDYRAFFNAQWRTKCAVINWKCVVTKGCSCSDKTIYQSKEMFKFKDLYRAQRLFMDTVHLVIYETCILYNYMTAFITQQ